MKTKSIVLVGVLAAMAAAAPVATAPADAVESATASVGDACLQNNRLWGWQVVNPRAVSVTDRTNKRFMIRLAGGCVGLNNSVEALEIRGDTALSCVRRGNFIRFRAPALGSMSCAITDIALMPAKSAAEKTSASN